MASQIKLDIYPFTDKGSREYQEDFLYTDPVRTGQPWLGIVSDGMGGHQGGDVASKSGVHALRASFEKALNERVAINEALSIATTKGHEAVLQAAAKANAVNNMGATVVAFVIDEKNLHWCTAGDSRLYLFRKGKVEQLSRDFTIGEDMRLSKQLNSIGDKYERVFTEDEINQNPQRNALTSFMGTDNWRFDARSTTLRPGDIIIACSDGVYGTIDIDGIAVSCATGGNTATAQQIAESMMKRILDIGKSNQDNSTAIIVRFEPVDRVVPMRLTKKPRSKMPWVVGGLVASMGLASVGWFATTKLFPVDGKKPKESVDTPAVVVTGPPANLVSESNKWQERVSNLEKQFKEGDLTAEEVPSNIKSLRIELKDELNKMTIDVRDNVMSRLKTLRVSAMKAELENVEKEEQITQLVLLEQLTKRWNNDLTSEPEGSEARVLLNQAENKFREIKRRNKKASSAQIAKAKQDVELKSSLKKLKNVKKGADADAQKKGADADAQKKAADADAQKKAADADAQKKAADADAQKKAADADAQKKAADADAQKKAADADAQKKKADEDKARAALNGNL